jgi:uncharacterized membrane protein YkvI
MLRNLTMLTGTLTAVPVMVVAMFTISDPDAVMNASFPAIELIYQVTGNRPLTIFLSVWLIVIYACKFRLMYNYIRRYTATLLR